MKNITLANYPEIASDFNINCMSGEIEDFNVVANHPTQKYCCLLILESRPGVTLFSFKSMWPFPVSPDKSSINLKELFKTFLELGYELTFCEDNLELSKLLTKLKNDRN